MRYKKIIFSIVFCMVLLILSSVVSRADDEITFDYRIDISESNLLEEYPFYENSEEIDELEEIFITPFQMNLEESEDEFIYVNICASGNIEIVGENQKCII